MFNLKKKIKFLCSDLEIAKVYPITPAKNYSFEWKKRFSDSVKKNFSPIQQKFFYLCPGINTLHSSGWILLNNRDVYLRTNSDQSIDWKVNYTGSVDYIGSHEREHFGFFENWPSHINKTVLKFNTGWSAVIPKNYTLLQMPLIFYDDDRFTTVSGMYHHTLGLAALTVPVFWNVTSFNETIIKAGTPLAQLLLIKNEDIGFEIGNDTSKTKMYDFLTSSSFRPNYKNFLKHFK